jgi:hypothetical protein
LALQVDDDRRLFFVFRVNGHENPRVSQVPGGAHFRDGRHHLQIIRVVALYDGSDFTPEKIIDPRLPSAGIPG